MSTPKYLNRRQIVERGWTENSILRFLGEPDLSRNHPQTGREVKFWSRAKIEHLESSDSWKRWKQKKDLLELVEKSHITINRLEPNAIRIAAISAYNHLHGKSDNFRPATSNSDPSFVDRITVNYIRHEQTNYDKSLQLISRKVGKAHAYALLKNRVLSAISQEYPELQEECTSQRVSIQEVLRQIS